MVPEPLTTIATVVGLINSSVSLYKKVQDWRDGRRKKVELATDSRGKLHSCVHDGSALMAQPVLLPKSAAPAMLCGSFVPADDVAARRLTWTDQALVAVWPYGRTPEYESILFTW